jgi:fibronectin-binding autotransporter adhesin
VIGLELIAMRAIIIFLLMLTLGAAAHAQCTVSGSAGELVYNSGSGGGCLSSSAAITSSGALTLPAISGTGLSVTSNATIGGTLGVTGATTLSGALSGTTAAFTGSGTGLSVTNDATIGGTLSVTGATALSGGGTLSGTFGGTPTLSGLTTHTSELASTFSPTIATGGANCTTTQYVSCQFSRPSGTVFGIAFVNSQTLDDAVNSSSNVIDNNYQINVGGGPSTGGAVTSSTTPAGAPQTGATNGTTAAGNATLNFAATPGFVATNMVIEDITTPPAITANTVVQSSTGTTVVMTNNAAGAGVGSGDLIAFYAAGSNVLTFTSVPAGWSTCNTVCNWIADQTGGQIVAGSIIFAKGATTVTLTHPVVAAVASSDQFFAFSTYTSGNRVGSSVNVTQTIAGMTSSGISSGGGASIWMQGNLGGNALNHVGAGNGQTVGCTAYATALKTAGCSGLEIDMIRLTATAGPQAALVIIENTGSIPSEMGGDTGIFIGAASGATSVFHYGISFAAPNSVSATDPFGSLIYFGKAASGPSASLTGLDTAGGVFHGCEHMSPYHAECGLHATGVTSAKRLTSDGLTATGFLYMLNMTADGANHKAEPSLTVTGCSGATAATGRVGAGGGISSAMPVSPGSVCIAETTVAVGLAGATSLATIAAVIAGNTLNLPINSTNTIQCAVSAQDASSHNFLHKMPAATTSAGRSASA